MLEQIKDFFSNCLNSGKAAIFGEKSELQISIDYILEILNWFKDVDDSTMDMLKFMIAKTTKNLEKKLKEEDIVRYKEGIKSLKKLEESKKGKKGEKKEEENENILYAMGLFINKKHKNSKENNNHNNDNINENNESPKAENVSNNKNASKNENDDDKFKYFVFDFEEFLLIFLKFIRFIIGIEARVEFYENNELFVYLHLNKKVFPIVAEAFDYELQSNPYAKMFKTFVKAKKLKGKRNKLNFKEEEDILVKILKEKTTFVNMSHKNHLNFPPYFPFERCYESKFRKYWPNDEFHNCYRDPEFRPYREINLVEEKNYNSESEHFDSDELENEEDFLQYKYKENEELNGKFYN